MLRSVGIAPRDATAPQPERLALPAVRVDLQARATAAGLAEALLLADCSRTELHTVLAGGPVRRLGGPMNFIVLYFKHTARTTLVGLNALKPFRSGPLQLIRVTRPARTPLRPTNSDESGH